jgi:hypothetical protein
MVYDVYTMERKQIYLDAEQDDELKELARREQKSVSALIREAVAIYLDEHAVPKLKRPEDHPLWGLIGIAGGEDMPADGSINHDRDLYGGERP